MRLALVLVALALAACGSPALTVAPEPAAANGATAQALVVEEAGFRRARTDRRLVRTAELELTVEDEPEMPPVRERAAAIAEAAGGYVEAEGPREMTLRIPDPELEASLDALGALARETHRAVRAADVTEQVTDLEIRLANARALRDRLAALLEQAATVEEVLEVERELARVTTEVERLEAQLRALQDRVALASVRLSLREDTDLGPVGFVVVSAFEAVKWLFVRD